MDRELFLRWYRKLDRFACRIRHRRPPNCVYCDVVIAAVHHWAVLHDRPDCWGCIESNWSEANRWRPFPYLPSQSCLSRRLRSESVRRLLDAFYRHLAHDVSGAGETLVKRIDSKPLPVGVYSRAKDARWGMATKKLLKGYKLFALYGRGVMPIAFEVSSMNAGDVRVGRRLVRHLPGTGCGTGYVLADSGFDPNGFYDACEANNHQAVVRRKKPNTNPKPQGLHPHRARAIDLIEGERDGKGGRAFGKQLFKLRTAIERDLARLTNTGGGLGPLPNWVRNLPRVQRWVRAKLLLHGVRHLPVHTLKRWTCDKPA